MMPRKSSSALHPVGGVCFSGSSRAAVSHTTGRRGRIAAARGGGTVRRGGGGTTVIRRAEVECGGGSVMRLCLASTPSPFRHRLAEGATPGTGSEEENDEDRSNDRPT